MPQSATFTFFRTPMPAISDLSRFGFSPLTIENKFRLPNTLFAEIKPFKKKVVSSAYAVYRKSWSKIFRLLISLFDLINVKSTSNARIKRYAEIGSP